MVTSPGIRRVLYLHGKLHCFDSGALRRSALLRVCSGCRISRGGLRITGGVAIKTYDWRIHEHLFGPLDYGAACSEVVEKIFESKDMLFTSFHRRSHPMSISSNYQYSPHCQPTSYPTYDAPTRPRIEVISARAEAEIYSRRRVTREEYEFDAGPVSRQPGRGDAAGTHFEIDQYCIGVNER